MNTEFESKDYFGKNIDALINLRDKAKIDLPYARMALLRLGVKTIKDGQLSHLPGLHAYQYFNCSDCEFYWEAEYENGEILKQYDGDIQHHYGHIDQSRLLYFRWISNFDWETDSKEKRVIVTLDFKKGTFTFTNGFCSQELRKSLYDIGGTPNEKKLVIKIVKRKMTSINYPDGTVDEVSYYNRFLIGFKSNAVGPTRSMRKVILCIEPNGVIHEWHDMRTDS